MKREIPEAKKMLVQLKKYDRAHGIPHGDYSEIEIAQSGVYLTKPGEKLKIAFLKKTG